MGCTSLILIFFTILILLLPGGSELVFTKEFLILTGGFWFCCFIIWLLFGDIIDYVTGVDQYNDK